MANNSNLMIAVQQLITHKSGKKAFLEIQTEKMQLSETELKALADNPEFTESQKKAAITFAKTLHRNQVNTDLELQLLLFNFEKSENTEEKPAAWQALADIVLRAYYLLLDDNTVFKTIREVNESLAVFTDAYINEFNAKLQNNKPLAIKIAHLLFCVANFYNMADQAENFAKWYNKAEHFILNNDLENAQEYAILLSIRAEEILRHYKPYNADGTLNKFPEACVLYYQRALNLHVKIGSTLNTDSHMRHVQMCLAIAKMQSLQYKFESTNTQTANFRQYAKEESNVIFELLHTLYPTLGLDGYRISQCLQTEAQLYLLQGELTKAVEMATASIPFMPEKNSGPRSNLLNKVGNIYIVMANVMYQNINSTESKFMIQRMANHPYTKITHKLTHDFSIKISDNKKLLDVADNFVVMAAACYIKSYHLSKSLDQPGHIYSQQAKIALQQIAIKDDVLDSEYFNQPLEELLSEIMDESKIPDVAIDVAAGPSFTTMFTNTLQNGLNTFKDALMSVVYNPFAAAFTPATPPQHKP